jgi:hypothetical protein
MTTVRAHAAGAASKTALSARSSFLIMGCSPLSGDSFDVLGQCAVHAGAGRGLHQLTGSRERTKNSKQDMGFVSR